jgi:hypothetical protein
MFYVNHHITAIAERITAIAVSFGQSCGIGPVKNEAKIPALKATYF